uniref:ankyrin repeat domain-containing protein n=1 Tax=Endozoicomonas acroporae TaxID=1701104 RepID=UPI001C60E4DD
TEIVRAFKEIAPMRIQVDVKNNNGDTALHEAARQGHTETVNALLEIVAKEKTNDGQTALHKAAEKGHTEAIQKLLTIDPSLAKEKDNNGRTALHAAALKGHTEAIQTLLTIDPSLAKEKDKRGNTALHLAASEGHKEAIQTFLTIPSSLAKKKKEKDKSVRTALTAAVNATAFAVHTEATQSLQTIDPSQAKKKEKDKSVRSALAAAVNATAFAVHTEATQPLQSIGPSLAKEKDNDGQTALHKAASQGHTKAIQTLPKIDPSLAKETDNSGRMAVHLAVKGSHEDAIFGYSGIRGNLNTINPKGLKQIYAPVQFIPGFELNNNLSLDGYPFHIEGTKDKIIEFLDKYERFHFTAKSIGKKEQSKARVSVDIQLCLADCDLPKMVRNFFVAPIKDTFDVIPLDFINGIIEHANLQGSLKIISDAVNTSKKKLQEELQKELQKEVVNTAEKMQKNLSGEVAEQPEKIASKKFDSVINKIRNELKRLNETDDIDTSLSKKNFKVCSGPINLLHNIKKGQKIQIEFDRFDESSNSPARLQINSTGSQVEFKDLSEALKMIFEI